jgi:hypothetical protein
MIYANIASIPSRTDCLIETVESLYNQVDEINIGLNNYTSKVFNDKKINEVLLDNSKGDAAKVFFLDKFSGFAFLCDDDLIYPQDYVSNTLKYMDEHEVVTYHGRTLIDHPITSYYRSQAIKYRCLSEVVENVKVQVGGTGVMAFHTNDLKISYDRIKQKNMLDLVISAEAQRQKKDIVCLKHSEGWLKYNPKMLNRFDTIYDEHVRNDEVQTNFFNNQISKLKKC